MKHHDRGLIVIMIATLFSLASLQAVNLLVKYSSSRVLGQSTSATNANNLSCEEISRLQQAKCQQSR